MTAWAIESKILCRVSEEWDFTLSFCSDDGVHQRLRLFKNGGIGVFIGGDEFIHTGKRRDGDGRSAEWVENDGLIGRRYQQLQRDGIVDRRPMCLRFQRRTLGFQRLRF